MDSLTPPDPASPFRPDPVGRAQPNPPPLTDLLMLHHGLATSAELLSSQLPAGIGRRPFPGPELPWPAPPRFLHTYYPVDHVLLKAIIPGYRRYEYQEQQLVPGPMSGGLGRAIGYLYNRVDIPPGSRNSGPMLSSYASFAFRFKPFDSDGARGIATVRLPNLRFELQKQPYRQAPGSDQPQFIEPGDELSTGFSASRNAGLYVRLSVPDLPIQPPAPPDFPLPARHPIAPPDYRVVFAQQDRVGLEPQRAETQVVHWRDLDINGKLSFPYEAGVELLVEVGLFTLLQVAGVEGVPSGGGLRFSTRTQIEAVHVDTLRLA